MSAAPRPHVSAALQHLRRSILGAAGVLALCLLVHMFLFIIAHMGDAHQVVLESGSSNTRVVEASTEVGPALPRDHAGGGVEVNTVGSATGFTLHRTAEVVETVGIISALLLVVLMFQAVCVAGGAGVPGVEKAVTSCTWVIIIALCVLPLGKLMPAVMWSGVFGPFDELVAASDRFRAGGANAPGPISFYGVHFALPVLLLGGLVAAVLRFHAGIEAGVVVTHASQLDEKLEREIRSLKLGQLAQPRAVGALDTAIGETVVDARPPMRPLGQSSGTEPPSRPI